MTTPTPTLIRGANLRRTVYHVTYATVDMGLCDAVDPSKFKLVYEGITTGSTGAKNKLGDRFVGVEGTVSVELRQLNAAQYRALCPWAAATGGITLTPPLNADMYQYAQTLTLHPEDMAADASEDLIFPFAVPIALPLAKRDGAKDDVLPIDFAIYPSRAAMTASALNVSSGSIGTMGS